MKKISLLLMIALFFAKVSFSYQSLYFKCTSTPIPNIDITYSRPSFLESTVKNFNSFNPVVDQYYQIVSPTGGFSSYIITNVNAVGVHSFDLAADDYLLAGTDKYYIYSYEVLYSTYCCVLIDHQNGYYEFYSGMTLGTAGSNAQFQLPGNCSEKGFTTTIKVSANPLQTTITLKDCNGNVIGSPIGNPGYGSGSGTVASSEIALNSVNEGLNNIRVSPIPAKNNLNVNLGLANPSDVQFTVYNAVGNVVYKTQRNSSSNASYNLDVSSLNVGVYFLKINTGKNEKTIKFVKE